MPKGFEAVLGLVEILLCPRMLREVLFYDGSHQFD